MSFDDFSFLIGNKHFCLIQFVILKKHELNQAISLEQSEQQNRESTKTTRIKYQSKNKRQKT